MKKFVLLLIYLSVFTSLQAKENFYTKETVIDLLKEGDISKDWKDIILSTAENIDKGDMLAVVGQSEYLGHKNKRTQTPNEFVLYNALIMLNNLYSYRPIMTIVLYNTVPGLERFEKASSPIKSFFTIVGTISISLLKWEEFFTEEQRKYINGGNEYLQQKYFDILSGNNFYSNLKQMVINLNKRLDQLADIEQANGRSKEKAIQEEGEQIVTKIYQGGIQKYPNSPILPLLYYISLAEIARSKGLLYQKYHLYGDNIDYNKTVDLANREIKSALVAKEVPLTLNYDTARDPETANFKLYQRWVKEFDPGNLYAHINLITAFGQAGKLTEAEAQLKAAKDRLKLVPYVTRETMSYYFADIGYREMLLAIRQEDYQRLADITPETVELSQDFPIVLRKIAGIFSNTSFMQKVGKQVGAKFYLDNFIQGGYKAAKRITDILPKSDYLAADIFNLSFYEFMRLDESDVAYQELVKIAENKLSMSKNTANQVKDLYYRIVKYYTPPGGVPEDVKKYFGVD